MKHIFFYSAIISIVLSCTNTKTKHNISQYKDTNYVSSSNKNITNNKPVIFSIKPDTVYKSIKSNTVNSYSYSIYLPSTSGTGKHPVLALFDPHADGKLPIEKYKSLAKKFGFVLIASNNSQNGLSGNDYYSILHAFYNDLITQFSNYIDTSRMFCGGFSGGGRVASMFAYTYKLPVVISCGAGVSNPQTIKFDFLGFVGNEDFNFVELYQLQDFLNKNTNYNHFVEFFNGIHEWPDTNVFADAFYYLDFYMMRHNKLEKDNNIISSFINKVNNQISNTKSAWKKANLLNKKIAFLSGLTDLKEEYKALSTLHASNKYKQEIEQLNETLQEEKRLQQAYASVLLEKPTDWWKKKISEFDKKIKKSSTQKVLMYKRLKNYLSLAIYMSITHYLKTGNILYASQLLDIYKIVDPQNKEIPNLEKEIKQE